MISTMVKVKCEMKDCSQFDHVKTVQKFAGQPGPGLAFKAAIICLGCGVEPRILED